MTAERLAECRQLAQAWVDEYMKYMKTITRSGVTIESQLQAGYQHLEAYLLAERAKGNLDTGILVMKKTDELKLLNKWHDEVGINVEPISKRPGNRHLP